jgi:hypothetical protein
LGLENERQAKRFLPLALAVWKAQCFEDMDDMLENTIKSYEAQLAWLKE